MDAFIKFTPERQRRLCEAAGDIIGLDASSIEKDFWVCWTLRELFNLPESGTGLTFKGGTSLSKGWKLIERFSEDIDVVIDRDFLGFGGDHAPDRASSRKQTEARLENLRSECQKHIHKVLQPALDRPFASIFRPDLHGNSNSIRPTRINRPCCSSIHPLLRLEPTYSRS